MQVQGIIHIDLVQTDNAPIQEILEGAIKNVERAAGLAGVRVYIDQHSFLIDKRFLEL